MAGILAAKVQRQDSLARFLSQRPQRKELIERNILPHESEHERHQHRAIIGTKLNRSVLPPTAPHSLLQHQSSPQYANQLLCVYSIKVAVDVELLLLCFGRLSLRLTLNYCCCVVGG